MIFQIDENKAEKMLRVNAAMVGDTHALLSIAVEAIEQLTALTLNFAVDAVNSGTEQANTLLDTEHLHQAMALQAEQILPSSKKIVAYTVDIFRITNEASTKITNLLNANFQEMYQDLDLNSIEAAKKSLIAPEIAIAAVKEATQVRKIAHQNAMSVSEASKNLAVTQINTVTKTAPKTRPKVPSK